jgi:hypothetical protein
MSVITTGNFPKGLKPGKKRGDEMDKVPRTPKATKPRKPKTSKGLREWRAEQPPGAIMKPATFKGIVEKAAASGATDPEAVAGAAYWQTAKAKYKGRKRGKRKE